MTKLENRTLKLVKENKGITNEILGLLANRGFHDLKKALKSLHLAGCIAYLEGKLYPCYRSISVYEKGVDEYIKEKWTVHGEVVLDKEVLLEEVELKNHITTLQLRRFIKHSEDDAYYCWSYEIDEKSAVLFEMTNKVEFDFNRFEYVLNLTMDNVPMVNN